MTSECDHLRKAKGTAEAVLRGDVPILEAARSLTSALIDTRLTRSGPACFFNSASSETDDLPLGRVREHWEAAALREKDRQAAAYEARIRDQFLVACREIVSLIGEISSKSPRTPTWYDPIGGNIPMRHVSSRKAGDLPQGVKSAVEQL